MYREAVKFAGLGIVFAGLFFCGCSSSESEAAESLLEQVSDAVENGNSTLALTLLDSLQRTYPALIKEQREGMKLRPKAMEIAIQAQIQSVDSLLSLYADSHKTLGEKMKTVSSPELVEPYMTPMSGYQADFVNSTGVQARIDRAGQFYLVSSVNPGGVGHTSLTFISGEDEVTTGNVPYDGELNYRLNGTEVVTFMPAKSDTVGSFMVLHRNHPVTLRFNGEKGKSRQIKLSAAQTEGIADAYTYSLASIRGRDLSVEREKLDRQLQIARDQSARLSEE